MAALPVSVGRAPPVGPGRGRAKTGADAAQLATWPGFFARTRLPLPRRGSENLSAGTGKIVKR
jgi:hypothetical protein